MVLASFVTTPSAAFAQGFTGSSNVLPGCSPDFWRTQQNYAAGLTASRMIAGKQIVNQPSPTNVLGCFDQAMIASAKAGAIFSDRAPSSLPTFNPLTAIGLGSSIGGPFGNGTTSTLMTQIGNVVDPVLSNLLGNVVGGLTSSISSTLSSAFSGIIGPLTSIPVLGNVMSSLMGVNMDCNVMQETWDNQVIGQGLDQGYSFMSMGQLMDRSNLPATLGAAALAQIAANAGIFDAIRDDHQNMQTRGYYDFNPIVPTLGVNASVQDVINAMQ